MKKYILYKHLFPNGKVYIGITSKANAELRWRNGRGYQTQRCIAQAIAQYGWDNIKHEILATNVPEDEISILEQQTIQQYQANNPEYGYNILEGGLDGFARTGTAVLMYDLQGNYIRSFLSILDACDYCGVNSGGSIAAACSGKRKSIYGYQWRFYAENFPLKIEAIDFATSRRIKRVEQYNKNGTYIQTFDSISAAGAQTNVSGADIGKVCRGERKTAGGYLWRYASHE